MRAHFSLPSVEGEELDSKRPISVKFEIPYFTTSGLQVIFSYSYKIFLKIFYFLGSLPEDHREKWLPSTALGSLRHPEWRLFHSSVKERGRNMLFNNPIGPCFAF